MVKIEALFRIYTAKSHAFQSYPSGDVAFVSNGFSNNGVVGYVEPISGDKVFQPPCITISAFCEATVQSLPFIARGNGGSGLAVLEPLQPTDEQDLLWYAAYVNETIQWRFSFGRMVTADRLKHIQIPDEPIPVKMNVNSLLPIQKEIHTYTETINLTPIPLTRLFIIKSGDYHNASELSLGKCPLISCGKEDNGLVFYYGVPTKNIYSNALTVAYNGAPLTVDRQR